MWFLFRYFNDSSKSLMWKSDVFTKSEFMRRAPRALLQLLPCIQGKRPLTWKFLYNECHFGHHWSLIFFVAVQTSSFMYIYLVNIQIIATVEKASNQMLQRIWSTWNAHSLLMEVSIGKAFWETWQCQVKCDICIKCVQTWQNPRKCKVA